MYYFLLGFFLYLFCIIYILRDTKKITNIVICIVLIFLTLMIGFRYDVGVDYLSYERIFLEEWNDFGLEPFYTLINYIVMKANGEFYLVMMISIFITNLFVGIYLKRLKWKPTLILFSLFIYTVSSLFLFTNGVRQGIAISIVFYSVVYIEQKNFKRFFICILLASLFHVSAIVMLILYFIKIKFSKILYLALIFIAYIFVQTEMINKFLNIVVPYIPYYNFYLYTGFLESQSTDVLALGVLVKVLISIYITFINKEENILITFYQIGILLNILAISTFMVARVGFYFYIFDMVVIPMVLMQIKSKLIRRISFIVIFILFLALFIKMLLISPEESNLVYKWIFDIY